MHTTATLFKFLVEIALHLFTHVLTKINTVLWLSANLLEILPEQQNQEKTFENLKFICVYKLEFF